MNIGRMPITLAILGITTSMYSMQKYAALHEAAQHGHLEDLQRFLIIERVPVDTQNSLGQTALMLAVRNGNVAIVETLMRLYNARLDRKDNKKCTALHYAAQKGHGTLKDKTRIAQLLIQAGANVNAQSSIGYTPLHIAVIANQDVIALELLKFGADKEIADLAGLTPLNYAVAKKNTDMIFFLSLDSQYAAQPQQNNAQPQVDEIRKEVKHQNEPISPTLHRLMTVREKLKAFELVHREEEDAQEDSFSQEN